FVRKVASTFRDHALAPTAGRHLRPVGSYPHSQASASPGTSWCMLRASVPYSRFGPRARQGVGEFRNRDTRPRNGVCLDVILERLGDASCSPAEAAGLRL